MLKMFTKLLENVKTLNYLRVNWPMVIKLLLQPKNILILVLPAILGALIFFLFEYQEDYSVFPGKNINVTSFSDSKENKGNTMINSFAIKDNTVSINYKIGNTDIKYAGIDFTATKEKSFNFITDYNKLSFEIETSNLASIDANIRTFEKGITHNSNPDSYRYNSKIFNLKNGVNILSCTINDFATATWWERDWSTPGKELPSPDWTSTQKITLAHGSVIDASKNIVVTVKKITLGKSYSLFFIIFLNLYLLCIVIFMWIKIQQSKQQEPIVIQFKPVEDNNLNKNDNTWEKELIKYLANNYTNPELSLQLTSKMIGKNEKIISSFIMEKYKLAFREYLNYMRLQEAKRMLSETDISIKEILYSVGYSTANHFTRVFKQYENCTPSEFREKNTKKVT